MNAQRNKKNWLKEAGLCFLLILFPYLLPAPVLSFQLSLAWEPNADPEIAGYKVYIGTQTGKYSWDMDAGRKSQATVGNLVEGTRYFFSVTSYTADKRESDYSNEVSYGGAVDPKKVRLTVGKLGNGSGDVSGTGINCGSDCSESMIAGTLIRLTATPTKGSAFGGWSGSCTGLASSCVFNINAGANVSALFSLNGNFTITATAGANGSISPAGMTRISPGGSQAYRITAASGYRVADVQVDGRSVGALSAYTFTNVQANLTISAAFTSKAYSITATAGSGGSISPAGMTRISPGGSQTYRIAAASGYRVADVQVDGRSVGALSAYTFTKVKANRTISAAFSSDTYSITATAGSGGSISPAGMTRISPGGSQTYRIAAASGYRVAVVRVAGVSVGALSTYTFANVRANSTISAVFGQNGTYRITGKITD